VVFVCISYTVSLGSTPAPLLILSGIFGKAGFLAGFPRSREHPAVTDIANTKINTKAIHRFFTIYTFLFRLYFLTVRHPVCGATLAGEQLPIFIIGYSRTNNSGHKKTGLIDLSQKSTNFLLINAIL
jgi:hypothetical protein